MSPEHGSPEPQSDESKLITDPELAEVMANAEDRSREMAAKSLEDAAELAGTKNPFKIMRRHNLEDSAERNLKHAEYSAERVQKIVESIDRMKSHPEAQAFLRTILERSQRLSLGLDEDLSAFIEASPVEAYQQLTGDRDDTRLNLIENLALAIAGERAVRREYVIAGSNTAVNWNPLSAAIDSTEYRRQKGVSEPDKGQVALVFRTLGIPDHIGKLPKVSEPGRFGGKKSESQTYSYSDAGWQEVEQPITPGVNLRIVSNSEHKYGTEDVRLVPAYIEAEIV
jgi:hypothetical protein